MPRLAQLLTSTDFIGHWITQGSPGFKPTSGHLPSDARMVGAYNAHPGVIGLIFESTAFPESNDDTTVAMLPLIGSPTYRYTGPANCAGGHPSDN